MSKKQKLIDRFLSNPSDFTFDELVTMLKIFDFDLVSSGKTSGSSCKFKHKTGVYIFLHKPHPKPILKSYQINSVTKLLKAMHLI